MNTDQKKITLLLIAGGRSRRMGRNKALRPVPPDGTPLVKYVLRRVRSLTHCAIVVANDPAVCDVLAGEADQCIPDDIPDCGPLAGLATGLRRVDGWALTLATDMPFVSLGLCGYLITQISEEYDAVVPVLDGTPQPLHALYHLRCLPAIQDTLQTGHRRMDSFWKSVRVRTIPDDELRLIDPHLRSFTNLNTQNEWEQAFGGK